MLKEKLRVQNLKQTMDLHKEHATFSRNVEKERCLKYHVLGLESTNKLRDLLGE